MNNKLSAIREQFLIKKKKKCWLKQKEKEYRSSCNKIFVIFVDIQKEKNISFYIENNTKLRNVTGYIQLYRCQLLVYK